MTQEPDEQKAPSGPSPDAERAGGTTPTEYSAEDRAAAATGQNPAATPDTEAAAAARARLEQPVDAAPPETAAETAAAPAKPAAAARPARPAPAERAAPKGPEPPAPGSIYDTFTRVMPDIEWLEAVQGLTEVILTVSPEDVPTVMRTAKEHPDLAMDYLRSLHGVDQQPDGFDVVYLLYSYKLGHGVEIKTRVPLDDPRVASVTGVWKGANWHERETRDLFGVVFDGHPNLTPLLLPEDLIDVFPYRKDYPLAEIEELQGEGASQGEGGDE